MPPQSEVDTDYGYGKKVCKKARIARVQANNLSFGKQTGLSQYILNLPV